LSQKQAKSVDIRERLVNGIKDFPVIKLHIKINFSFERSENSCNCKRLHGVSTAESDARVRAVKRWAIPWDDSDAFSYYVERFEAVIGTLTNSQGWPSHFSS